MCIFMYYYLSYGVCHSVNAGSHCFNPKHCSLWVEVWIDYQEEHEVTAGER